MLPMKNKLKIVCLFFFLQHLVLFIKELSTRTIYKVLIPISSLTLKY